MIKFRRSISAALAASNAPASISPVMPWHVVCRPLRTASPAQTSPDDDVAIKWARLEDDAVFPYLAATGKIAPRGCEHDTGDKRSGDRRAEGRERVRADRSIAKSSCDHASRG